MSEVGLVSEKPQCKQDEKWPLTLGLRNERSARGGGRGERGSRTHCASVPADRLVPPRGPAVAGSSEFLRKAGKRDDYVHTFNV